MAMFQTYKNTQFLLFNYILQVIVQKLQEANFAANKDKN